MSDGFDKAAVAVGEVEVRPIRPDGRLRWGLSMDEHHYLGFRQFAGRCVRRVADWRRRWVALLGWQFGRSSVRCGTAGWAGTGRCSSAGCT